MIILNFDTALDKTYIALSKDDKILNTKIIKNTEDNYHSAFLISSIKSVLKENNMTPADINLIGVNVGPGSFTGIRAALTVAKVMGQELDVKIVPVPSLEILSKLNSTDKNTLTTLDARRDMAYIYTGDNIKTVTISELKEIINMGDYYVICDKSISSILDINDCMIYENGEHNLAKILNELTFIHQDKAVNAIDLKALYIQPPPVFVKK